MTVTYSQIEARRKRWKPQPMVATPFEIEDSGVPDALLKCIALGLELELPVAEWVASASKNELPISKEARLTLGRNIADENVHFKAFSYAAQAYPVPSDIAEEAKLIADGWLTNNNHPLVKAAVAESGVFLPSLFMLSNFGGQSLSNMATDVSTDEQRHVMVNWGILQDIGYSRGAIALSVDNLRLETLEYVFRGVNIKDIDVNLDFMVEQSDLLLLKGYAPELEALSIHSVYSPPFEIENSEMY